MFNNNIFIIFLNIFNVTIYIYDITINTFNVTIYIDNIAISSIYFSVNIY